MNGNHTKKENIIGIKYIKEELYYCSCTSARMISEVLYRLTLGH